MMNFYNEIILYRQVFVLVIVNRVNAAAKYIGSLFFKSLSTTKVIFALFSDSTK